jgi:hypothetical protein
VSRCLTPRRIYTLRESANMARFSHRLSGGTAAPRLRTPRY